MKMMGTGDRLRSLGCGFYPVKGSGKADIHQDEIGERGCCEILQD